MSRQTTLRLLQALPLPERPAPRVIGADDFALRKRQPYATVTINAETQERTDVLPDRKSEMLATWLRKHSGVEVVCRDGSAAYVEAIPRCMLPKCRSPLVKTSTGIQKSNIFPTVRVQP